MKKIAFFSVLLSVAATPVLAAHRLPATFDGYPVCSTHVTDKCIESYAVRQDLAHAHHASAAR